MMMNIFVWLFESSILIVMILGIRKIFTGKISYSVLYALWGIVLLRLILPVNVFPTHLSLENIFVGEQTASVGKNQNTTGNEDGYSEAADGKNAGANTTVLPVSPSDDLAKDMQKKPEDLHKEAQEKGNVNLPAVGQMGDAEEKNVIFTVFSGENMVQKILFAFWISVAFVMFCWLIFSNLRFLRKVRKSRVLLGSQGRVKIYAAAVPGACLYGVFKPAIYLPSFLIRSCLDREGAGMEGQGTEEYGILSKSLTSLISGSKEIPLEALHTLIERNPQLSQIIAHELTHYRHGDHIWAMVRTALLVVYWFNPFVWLAARFSRKDAELCCDEATIRQIGEEKRFDYGEMLIRLAGSAGQEKLLYSAVFMSRRGKDMEKRIRAISERKQYSKWIAVPLIILLLVAVGITCSRAVSSSGQPDNTIDLAKGNDTAKTTEEMAAKAKEEAVRQAKLKESQEIYQSFLKEHGKEEKYRYYSLAELEKGQCVLMATDHVIKIDKDEYGNPLWGSSSCDVYNIIFGKAAPCGTISCSSSGEWIHLMSDSETGAGQLATDTHHSISRYTLQDWRRQLTVDIREEFDEMQQKEYWNWYDEFFAAPGVIFYTNPAVEKVKKNEPKALELTGNSVDRYAKRILSHTMIESEADVTGDGVKDTIRMELDKVQQPADDMENSVTVISGSSGKEIYGLNVNLIHAQWMGVYLYSSGGHTSLMTWQPVMYQGMADYHWEIFDVSETGRQTILAQDSLSFDLNHVKEDDPEKLEKFVEKFNSYLKDASRIIEVSDGRILEGGVADYERGGHYKGEFDEKDGWNLTYTAETELKAMREALE